MRKGAARWMDAEYDPEDNGGAPKMTLEEAIKKLFENVLDEEDEAVIMPDKALKTGLNSDEQQNRQNEQERNHEEIKEKAEIARNSRKIGVGFTITFTISFY